ncbi:uncharacterized protein LOC120359085 [Solenopsis invicta]|uniref:uncharacterized protein LOC120359085 n=1 Tax=Solenopsis invicta TaxID=13686 RepID=UPI00193CC63D|nr:uncharacterized protein LOC120359085 [Solenopsis invicta]
MRAWKRNLIENPPAAGSRILEAVLPHLDEWVGRPFGGLSYRTTQVLTGHGCFGEYLCRIKKEPTTRCHHCGAARDSAQHTLVDCPAWEELRGVLRAEIGNDISLPPIISQMVGRESAWKAVSSFCEQVMLQKEEAEKVRERRPGGQMPPGNANSGRDGRDEDHDPTWLPPRPPRRRRTAPRPPGSRYSPKQPCPVSICVIR